MISILIVDDHSVVRQGMIKLIEEAHPEWNIYEAENGVQAILAAARVKPDLILMDHIMPKLDGIKASNAITRDQPGSRIIMITMSNREEVLPWATEAGISRLIPKDASAPELMDAIGDMAKTIPVKPGFHTYSSDYGKRKEKEYNHDNSLLFTDREMEVIHLMMKGRNAGRIADFLGISIRTVEGHRLKIMKKCGVHSYQEFFNFVLANKIIEVHS